LWVPPPFVLLPWPEAPPWRPPGEGEGVAGGPPAPGRSSSLAALQRMFPAVAPDSLKQVCAPMWERDHWNPGMNPDWSCR